MADPPRPPAAKGGGIFAAKVAGIPVWLLVVAAAGMFYLYRRQQAANAAAAAAGAGAATTGTGTAPGLLGGAVGGGGGGITSTGGLGTGAFPDNNSWYTAALNALQAQGFDPLSAASALSAYLGGGQLSTQAQSLVDLAIGRVGAPPNAPTIGGAITQCPPGSYYDPVSAGCLPLPGSGAAQGPPSAPGGNPTPSPPPPAPVPAPTPSTPPATPAPTPAPVAAAPSPAAVAAANAPPPSLAALGYVFNPTLGYDVPSTLTYPEALYLQQHPGVSPVGAGF